MILNYKDTMIILSNGKYSIYFDDGTILYADTIKDATETIDYIFSRAGKSSKEKLAKEYQQEQARKKALEKDPTKH